MRTEELDALSPEQWEQFQAEQQQDEAAMDAAWGPCGLWFYDDVQETLAANQFGEYQPIEPMEIVED